jgi:hypothetical protein
MWLFYLLFIVILIAGGIYFLQNIRPNTQEGITFRDLNKHGKLDPYEDLPHHSENPLFPFGHGLCY